MTDIAGAAYRSFLESELKQKPGFGRVVEHFKNIKGRRVLILAHDDPDGLTSGAILARLASRLGATVRIICPPSYELQKAELTAYLKDFKAETLVIADKGTIGYYDDYVGIVPEVVVVDHHPPQGGSISKCTVFNPAAGQYVQSSASTLAHMIAAQFGEPDGWDDFMALAGMKSDWACEPATDFVAPYCKPVYDAIAAKCPNLTAKIVSVPTMFEVNQREKTTLLNQIAEAMFAMSGGGFQYFYNDREPELKDINQVQATLDSLMEWAKKKPNIAKLSTLDGFVSGLPNAKILKKFYHYYLQDWERAIGMFDTAAPVCKFGRTTAYMFFGNDVPLMPMAGSVKLPELKKRGGDEIAIFIMVNREKNGGVHFSIRNTGDEVHSGKIASTLADRLVAKFGKRGTISGGGHPRAAECKTRDSGAPMPEVLKIFFELLTQMDELAGKPSLDADGKKTAADIGLTYRAS